MNEIEKQILENQKVMMTFFKGEDNDMDLDLFLESCIEKTDIILRPNNREEDCCEMPEEEGHALVGGQVGEAAKLLNKFANVSNSEEKE